MYIVRAKKGFDRVSKKEICYYHDQERLTAYVRQTPILSKSSWSEQKRQAESFSNDRNCLDKVLYSLPYPARPQVSALYSALHINSTCTMYLCLMWMLL